MVRLNHGASSRHNHHNQLEHLLVRSLAISLALLVLLCSCHYSNVVDARRHRHHHHDDDYELESELYAPERVPKSRSFGGHKRHRHRSPSRLLSKYQGSNSTVPPYHNDPAKLKEYDDFKASPLFIESYDPVIKYLPDEQVKFARKSLENIVAIIKNIINEAVATKDYVMPSARLTLRYAGKLLQAFLRHRSGEDAVKNRYETKKSFFVMFANLLTDVIKRSTKVIKDKGLKQSNVDAEDFRKRALALMSYIMKIINKSPLGSYHKWTEAKVYMDDPAHPKHKVNIIDEGADLFARFRAMGFESMKTVVESLISMFRGFGEGKVLRSLHDIY